MPNKQPSFAERCELMRNVAERLQGLADIVADEALRMAAAKVRFSERRGEKTQRRAR